MLWGMILSKIKNNYWPKSVKHLAEPYLDEADEYVVIAEISSDPYNGYQGYRQVHTALIPFDELDIVLQNLGGIGFKVESKGPYPGVGKEGGFDSSFWVRGAIKGKRYEVLINSWLYHNKTVLLPDNGILMCYGLVPRQIEGDITCWDDPSKPTYDVIRVKSLSEYKMPDKHSPASIQIRREYLEDYLSLKGCAGVAVYYEGRLSSDDPDFDKALGENKSIELSLPGRKLVLLRVDEKYHMGATQKTRIWGCRLILKPITRPISEEKIPALLWPDHDKPISQKGLGITTSSLEYVYVKDDVLKEYENKEEFSIDPESGTVSHGSWWSVGYAHRYGRHHIAVEIRKLYEGTLPHVVIHFNKYAVSKIEAEKEKEIYGDRHVGQRAKEMIYAYLELIELLSTTAEKAGLLFKQNEIGGFIKKDVEYQGWFEIDAFKPLGNAISVNITEKEFLDRCLELFKLLENLKQASLRNILIKLGMPKEKIKDLKSLRLLGTLCQLATIARDVGLDLMNDFESILPKWDEEKKLDELSTLFALNCFRSLKGHVAGKKYQEKLERALEVFGIDIKDTKKGWGQALDMVYDKIISSFSKMYDLLKAVVP